MKFFHSKYSNSIIIIVDHFRVEIIFSISEFFIQMCRPKAIRKGDLHIRIDCSMLSNNFQTATVYFGSEDYRLDFHCVSHSAK